MLLHNIVDLAREKEPLRPADIPMPEPAAGELLIRVSVCGVCHTELDEIEGRTPPPQLPVVPGHQVIGRVARPGKGSAEAAGSNAGFGETAENHAREEAIRVEGDTETTRGRGQGFETGDRVGVAWIHSACGSCRYCRQGRENLCYQFSATGRDANGGYAEYMSVPAGFAYLIPDGLKDEEAAPLLCAGAIGYRSLRLTGIENGNRLGLTGFGASGHLVLRMAGHLFPDSCIYVFARNAEERDFARENGAVWAGDTDEHSPEKLHAIIDTTPAWKPVVEAMANLEPGGRLVINAIRKEEADKNILLSLDYPTHLWMEKEIKSVANVARQDVTGMLETAGRYGIRPVTQLYELGEANKALLELKEGGIKGAKVLRISDDG